MMSLARFVQPQVERMLQLAFHEPQARAPSLLPLPTFVRFLEVRLPPLASPALLALGLSGRRLPMNPVVLNPDLDAIVVVNARMLRRLDDANVSDVVAMWDETVVWR